MTHFNTWKNTSDFPDAWARPVCEWIAEQFSIPENDRHMVIRDTSRGGHGHAGRWRVVCSIRRRGNWRRDWKYSTMSWDHTYIVKSPLEAFVMLAAHELYHTCAEGRQMSREKRQAGGHWRQAMEFRTNKAAWSIVELYRLDSKRFLSIYRKSLRRERDKSQRERQTKADKNTPEYRLAKAERQREAWERRLKQAERRVRKWKAKVNRIRAAIMVRERRAATPA